MFCDSEQTGLTLHAEEVVWFVPEEGLSWQIMYTWAQLFKASLA